MNGTVQDAGGEVITFNGQVFDEYDIPLPSLRDDKSNIPKITENC